MTELNRDERQEKESRLERKIEHLDADLTIMELPALRRTDAQVAAAG